jgi:hypothetical protein
LRPQEEGENGTAGGAEDSDVGAEDQPDLEFFHSNRDTFVLEVFSLSFFSSSPVFSAHFPGFE